MSKKNILKVVFIRHGESVRNKYCPWPFLPDNQDIVDIIGHFSDRDTPLSEEGFSQARKTGTALRRKFGVPDMVFHSGYLRTRQTAEEILLAYKTEEKMKVSLIQEDFLRERAVGYVYNMRESEARKYFPWVKKYRELFSDMDFCPPGGESLSQVIDRLRIFVDNLKKIDVKGKRTIFVVSHGRAIQCAMYNLLGCDFDKVFNHPLGPIKNCGVTVFERRDRSDFFLEKYNILFWK